MSKSSAFIVVIKNTVSKLGVLMGLVVLGVVLSIVTPYFLTPSNLINILLQVSSTTITGVGMTFVILTGGIDLSVGSIAALAAVSMTVLHKYMDTLGFSGVSYVIFAIAFPMLVAVLVALCAGFLSGVLIAIGKLPPFIMTFGMMSIARGLAYVISKSDTIAMFPAGMRYLGDGRIAGIPVPIFVALLLVAAAAWTLKYTKFGRYVYALGGNREALELSGVNVNKVQISVYVVSAFCCAIAAFIIVGRLNIAQAVTAVGYEMDAIAAVIIGGTSINGGEGKVTNTLIGAIFVGTIRNGLNLLNVDTSVQPVVIGSVVVLTVLYDMYRKNQLAGKH